ncbi:MAG: hypothetical protein IJA90_04650 [Peptococcaceae bacterium]|nr:hypothetical protein [Peptococcaceae bacterium]
MKLVKMIPEILMGIGATLVICLFLTISIGSSFGLDDYQKLFVYIAFALSFEFLVISFLKELKVYAKNNKVFILIVSVFIAICYADLRFVVFSNAIQFEDFGTAIILALGFIPLFFEERIEEIKITKKANKFIARNLNCRHSKN